MAAPRVSIGLPVWNGEKYLDEALTSLVEQTFTDFEVIISDNGSTDRTEEICRAWAERDPRIRYIRNEENRGSAWNFNRVFHEAGGTYFKWAAYDDKLLPEWLEECVTVLDSDPEVVLAYTGVVQIDENDEFLRHFTKFVDVTAADPVDRIRQVFYDWWCLPVFGLIRRGELAATRLIGPYDSSDRALLVQLAALGTFHRVDEALFHHRDHPDNTIHAFDSQQARGAWFDPQNADAVTYWPNWRYQFNFALNIVRSPMTPGQKLRAMAALGGLMIQTRKHLLSDLVVAARGALRKLRRS
ncbi:MAG: glycosyltransferase [Acidimicrobiia bacterium]|nr:glycosyltransferase [Acidimicrobiia bacterium]